MTLVLAAVGAVVAGLLELTVAPHIAVAGVQPHLVLVLGVIWTVAAGLETGLVWAFAGGLLLDVLAPRPLGVSAFALLLSLGAAYVGGRALTRARPLAPIPLVFVLTIVNSLVLLVVLGALSAPISVSDPLRALLPGAVYDTVVAAVLGPLFVSLRDRYAEEERADW
ncbi:MAG TPA: rod shape-determining protein MreD [Candidatus Limnocylindrales bacterium]|nr:rod shape-determining protein MreD [Candidatus Limnocylindrales bacterium]